MKDWRSLIKPTYIKVNGLTLLHWKIKSKHLSTHTIKIYGVQYFPSIHFLYDSNTAKFETLFYSRAVLQITSIFYTWIVENQR